MVEVIDSARGLAQWLWEQFEKWQDEGGKENERTLSGFAFAHGTESTTICRIFEENRYGGSDLWERILNTLGKEMYVRVGGRVYTDWKDALQELCRHPHENWSPDQNHYLWILINRNKRYVLSNMEKTMQEMDVPFSWVIADKE